MNHEGAMLAFARLAALSARKQQLIGRDKFLILAGAAACRAGWPEVADRCRELVLQNNKLHIVGHNSTFADAMRDDDFKMFANKLDRFCTFERAEHLLEDLGIEIELPADSQKNAGDFALSLLSRDSFKMNRH